MNIQLFVWGYLIVFIFMLLIMTKKMTAFTSLVIVPIIVAIIAGFGPKISAFALAGLKGVSVTAIMLLFAIMFFGLMINVGLFDPLVTWILKMVKGDPLKVLVGTAILAAIVSVDGDGSTTTMIVCSALIPVYKKLDMKMLYLAVVIIMQNSIMNLLPWGGPTARIISALKVDEGTLLRSLVPGMIVAIFFVIGVSYYLGLKERKRLGIKKITAEDIAEITSVSEEEKLLKRPKLFWINFLITMVVMVLLIFGGTGFVPKVSSAIIFEVAFALALIINYPSLKTQREIIEINAGNALQVVVMVLAAGIFMGILTESKMADSIAMNLANIVPVSMGKYWAVITAIISVPGTFLLSNDAFYFGVVPLLAQTGAQYGFSAMEIGIASTMGQAFHLLSPLVGFIYLLLHLTGVDMGKWQRESAKYSIGTFIIFILMAFLTGAMRIAA